MAGVGTAHLRSPEETLLRVEHLVVEFPAGRKGLKVNAVTDVSIDVKAGEPSCSCHRPPAARSPSTERS